MKNIYRLFLVSGLMIAFSSCEDFLDRTPESSVQDVDFFNNAAELRLVVNDFYQDLPGWNATSVGFNVLPDAGTDMLIGETPSNRISGLSYEVPTSGSGSAWSWNEVRDVNFYLDRASKATAETDEEQSEIDQYIGEGYFFRAYYYFDLLTRYGDLPIFDQYFDNTDEDLVYAGRESRNEVAEFILSDLDMAISLLESFPNTPGTPRISKEVAQLFKARVALYEGTWEKYHAGTDFGVDGEDGSAFIQIAADAAKLVMESGVFSLHNDYGSLFNQVGLIGNSEVMLWRDYDHLAGVTNVLQLSWPNRCGYTRAAIRSYLCSDGLPAGVSPEYVGDTDLDTIETNRDPRLAATIMVPGDLILGGSAPVAWANPDFTTANAGLTGYESQKYRNVNIDGSNESDFSVITSRIIFRYAEALLIYAEAKAELGTITQTDLDESINLLRDRAGMPDLVLGSITTDPDWPDYGYSLSDVLYEIRRERTVELMAEGYRADDLYRWRAHSLFDGDQPRGAFYNDGVVSVELAPENANLDTDGYLLPFASTGDYNFDETRAYLIPIPQDELVLNKNLTQNPGWE